MNAIRHIPGPFADVGNNLVGNTMAAAQIGIPAILAALLVLAILKGMIRNGEIQVDYTPVIRGFFLFMVVVLYPEIAQMISTAVSSVTGVIPQRKDFGQIAMEMGQAAMNQQDPDPNDAFSLSWDSVAESLKQIFSFTAFLASLIQEGITLMIREGVYLIRGVLLVFLYLVGPIAIALSIIPGLEGSGSTWLKGFVGVQLWDLTLAILDHITQTYNLTGLANVQASEAGYGIVFNMVIIIMYLLVPTMTSYYVSVGSSNTFLGKVAGAAAAVMLYGRMGGAKSKVSSQAASANTTRQTTQTTTQQSTVTRTQRHRPAMYSAGRKPKGLKSKNP